MPPGMKEADDLADRVREHCANIGREVNVVKQTGSRHARYVITEKGHSKIPLVTFSAHSANRMWRTRAETDLRAVGLLPPIKHQKKQKEEAVPRLTNEEIVVSDAMRERIREIIRRFPSEQEARDAIVAKALDYAEQGKIETFGDDSRPPASVVGIHLKRLLDEGGGWKTKNVDRFAPVLAALERSLNRGTYTPAGNGNGNGHVEHEPEAEAAQPDASVVHPPEELEEIDVPEEEIQEQEAEIEEAEPETPADEERTLLEVAEAALQDAETEREMAEARVAHLEQALAAANEQFEESQAKLHDATTAREAQATRIEELQNELAAPRKTLVGALKDAEVEPIAPRVVEMLATLRAAQSPEMREAEAALTLKLRERYMETLLRFLDRTDTLEAVPDGVFAALNLLTGIVSE